MLNFLFLKDFILVQEATLFFEKGFTVVSGETGAGKTALIEALKLMAGEKADPNKIRKGATKATVLASFTIDSTSPLFLFLEEACIYLEKGEDLLIRREWTIEGKSRAFILDKPISNSFLQKIAPFLLEFVGQNKQILLKSSDSHRYYLDLFAGITSATFQTLWKQEQKLLEALQQAEEKKRQNVLRKTLLESQLDELLEVDLKEGEEQQIFEEYTLLINMQSLLENSSELLLHLEEITSRSAQLKSLLQKIEKYSPAFKEVEKLILEGHFQFKEAFEKGSYLQEKMEHNPSSLYQLEQRLKTLDRLHKKYGKNLYSFTQTLKDELQNLENIDATIQTLSQELIDIQAATLQEATFLTEERKKTSKLLEVKLSATLQALNMPFASCIIQITPCPRSNEGEDHIEFLLKTNLGQAPLFLKQYASGGELSRFLLALQLIFTEKNPIATLVFDEIDANIGGETATKIGQTLQELGRTKQILCITHFPQVACQADHHLRIYKEEDSQTTVCKFEPLTSISRKAELLRMQGGQIAQRQEIFTFDSP